MLCCIYCVRYTVLIAICVYVLFYSGKEERLQPIARSLNYKSNQSIESATAHILA